MAEPLICGGVEPFWSLEIDDTQATFSTPDITAISYEIPLTTPAEGRHSPVAMTLIGDRDTAIAIVAKRACTDTMSDIDYSHSIEVLTQRGNDAIMYSGCCRVRP